MLNNNSNHSLMKRRLNIQVYTGGSIGLQTTFFKNAASNYALEADFNYFDSAFVRNLDFTEKDFTNKCKSGDAYFIISHPMQGIVDKRSGGGLDWNCMTFADTLYDGLKDEIGFPEPEKLHDGSFTQDKYEYYKLLKDVCIPTLRLMRTKDGELDSEIRDEIYDFCCLNLEVPYHGDEGGWAIKCPFTTNGNAQNKIVQFCKTIEDITIIFKQMCLKMNHEKEFLPYFLLQPRLTNRKVRKFL